MPNFLCSTQGSAPRKAVDLALGVAIPVHSHIALNAVISDYVPTSVRGKTPICRNAQQSSSSFRDTASWPLKPPGYILIHPMKEYSTTPVVFPQACLGGERWV